MRVANNEAEPVSWPPLAQTWHRSVAVFVFYTTSCLPDAITHVLGTVEDCAKVPAMGTQPPPSIEIFFLFFFRSLSVK